MMKDTHSSVTEGGQDLGKSAIDTKTLSPAVREWLPIWNAREDDRKAYWAVQVLGFAIANKVDIQSYGNLREYCTPDVIGRAINFVENEIPEGILFSPFPRKCAISILLAAKETGYPGTASYAEKLSLPADALGPRSSIWFRDLLRGLDSDVATLNEILGISNK
jgi:hypothetical protein